MYSFLKFIILFSVLVFAGCGTDGIEKRLDTAGDLGKSFSLIQNNIEASPFILTSYERVTERGQVATLYIEGDGLAWTGRSTPSLNPTPINPLALRLAAADVSANVFYLARPCQYSKMITPNTPCPQKYWTDSRFAPEVIEAMNAALDNMKVRHNITGFNLVGFSGGGAVAVLLIARRDDVVSLRTVAGNLNHELLHRIHNVSQLSGSLNPMNVAEKINKIPQHHFIGGDDKVVPPAIAKSFVNASGDPQCIHLTIVPNATHEKGWLEHWPTLLNYPIHCKLNE